jgi:hypothetical protein
MPPFVARPSPLGLRPSRRDWLALGVPALVAGALAGAPKSSPARRAKSVLVVFASGGQSQLETWDPKPNAPAEIRGAFGSISTSLPGVRFTEHLPRVAKLANKLTVVRSMTHDDLDHGSACYLALTGQFHPRKSSNPPASRNDFPALGAVVHRVRPSDRFPHSAVHVNGPILLPELTGPGNTAGFLGRAYDPFAVPDPLDTAELVNGLTRAAEVSPERGDRRKELLGKLDRSTVADQHTVSTSSAFELLNAPAVRDAFDLDREPAKLRDKYGRYRAGQTCLLARRLVEAGVPWVTAFFNHTIRGQDKYPADADEYGWDTHNDIFAAMKDHLLPRFDQTFSTLLTDLEERGLLKDTLVVAMGEFGRAPTVALEKNFAGTSPGRKHWGGCYSVVLAGAGVKQGFVYGSSDRRAAYPQADPVTPGDLTATLLHALGLDPGGHYTDAAARPYRLAAGDPVTKLFD